jgi:quinolinate synthase
VLFAPDKNLGAYLVKKTGRAMDLWPGTCMVHEIFSEKKLLQLKEQNPGAPVIAHPECEAPILRWADHIGSTSSLLRYTHENPAQNFIVVTEAGIIHQMEKASPAKKFIPAPPDNSCACNECPHMKKNTLEKLRDCMRDLTPALEMDESLRLQARKPIDRMLALS